MSKRIAFLGTPEYACPALRLLASGADAEVVLVVTQPDRPAGRGRKLHEPPVKALAIELSLPFVQTATLRTAEARLPLVDARPDLIVVAAFGLILGTSVLSMPPNGCVNLHASLLPRYRGANPIAAAIADGERRTGVSLMRMERGLDTGPVYDITKVDINEDDTTESLTERLAQSGAQLLGRTLPALLNATAVPEPQGAGATCARPMRKDDGWIDWTLPADTIERHVRAMWPWPRAWTALPDGSRIQIHRASVVARTEWMMPGTLAASEGGTIVSCGRDAVRLELVQLPGGKPADGGILRSRIDPTGVMLGQSGSPQDREPLVVPCEGE